MKSWSHPDLGNFEFVDGEWQGTLLLPGFSCFHYLHPGKPNVPVMFEVNTPVEPLPATIHIAFSIVKSERKLSQDIIQTLAEDFNGRGYNSGMWWHGDLDGIREMMDEDVDSEIDLSDPASIPLLIGSPRVWIRPRVPRYEKPCAVILFDAAFDLEHGLGVLTDGTRVIGTGYQMSVTPYFEFQYRG